MAVKSVLNQSYTNIELIVVNDGSTDNTLDILSRFCDIKVISTPNKGVSHARNVGIDASKGEYISFLDADDELKDDAIDSLIKICIKHKSDICGGLFASEKNLNKYENQEICYEGDSLLQYCIEDHPYTYSACAKIYKRSFINDTRFCLGMRANEDSFFVFELALKKPKFTMVNQIVYFIKATPMSASRSRKSESYLDINYLATKKYEIVIKEHPDLENYAKNIFVKSNMATLKRILCIDDLGIKNVEKECIKYICENADYFIPATKFDKKFFFIITHHLYYIFKNCYKIKSCIRNYFSKV